MQPRKTYNTLVAQLFSVEPIKTDEPIDSTMRRKIQKLWEYLQANPAKVPKVSAGSSCIHSLPVMVCSKSWQRQQQVSQQQVTAAAVKAVLF